MLEPLIVLTVLNCFFMFSSTATTCALWWQYRHHRCCVKKVPSRQTCKFHAKKSKSCTSCHASKRTVKSKVDGTNKVFGTNKSVTNIGERDEKRDEKKDVEQRKSKNDISDQIKLRDHAIKKHVSEASQTTNDTKSTVVMEFSTVQKIVQIVDNNDDVTTAKMIVIPARDIIDKNKKYDLDTKNQFHREIASAEKISRSTIL